MRDWSRQDILGIAGLLVAVIACLASVMLPETRALLGLSTGEQTTPPVQQSSAPTPTAKPASTESTAVSPASPLPLQESGTGAEEEGTREAHLNAEVDSPHSNEPSSESEARLRNERSGRDQEALQYEEMRREAEARARREQPARDQTARESFDHEEKMREEAEARSRGTQTREKGLVRFKVEPADASLYLDGRFIGIARDLAAGMWVEAGDHRLAIVGSGHKGYEGVLTVTGGNSIDIELELESLK